jgi:hypothetical protein
VKDQGEIVLVLGLYKKHQAPTSKLQKTFKPQAPQEQRMAIWNLVLGAIIKPCRPKIDSCALRL